MKSILLLVVLAVVFRFALQVKAAYLEAEKERLRASGRKRNQPGEGRAHGERHYARVLGLKSNHGPDDVKQAYRRLAPQYHPDMVSHLGAKLREVAEQEMKEINEAYGYFKRKHGIR